MPASVSASGPQEPSPLLRVLINITLGSFVILLVTGVHLFFYYQPLAGLSRGGLLAGGTPGVSGLSELSRQLHVLAGWLVGVGVVIGVVAWFGPRQRRLAVLALPTAAMLIASGVIGTRARWHAVELAQDVQDFPSGIPSLFGDSVLSLFRDGDPVTAANIAGWFVLHVALASVACTLVAFAASRSRKA